MHISKLKLKPIEKKIIQKVIPIVTLVFNLITGL